MHRFSIRLPATGDIGYVGRVRNFAEDLYRHIEVAAIGTVRDIDRSTGLVTVEVYASRHLGTTRSAISKELRRHNLSADARVTRLTDRVSFTGTAPSAGSPRSHG